MIPVIKWPGGKRREIKFVEDLVPSDVDTIVEPFFGGGAFSLNFIDKFKIIGADIDRDLVHFYNLISNESFIEKLKLICEWWDQNGSEKPQFLAKLNKYFEAHRKSPTVKHEFYYACRSYYNFLKLNDKFNVDRALMFYLLRELSFSSMFRFNSHGEFNVPYGGHAYNGKSLLNKLKLVIELSKKNLTVRLSDFINIIDENKEKENVLIFLDPPYDSVFKDYNSNSFGQKDQIRLRDSLTNSKAKILMIINDTNFIRGLYDVEGFFITSFDKKYSVNFKNRNNQSVKHLIISNFRR